MLPRGLLCLLTLSAALTLVWSARAGATGADDPTLAWTATDGGLEQYAAPAAIVVDDCGNTYVAGVLGSFSAPDYYLASLRPDAAQRWVRRYDGPGHGQDGILSLALAPDDSVVVTGYSQGVGGVYEAATIKYDRNGNQQWVARFREPDGLNMGSSLAIDPSGNIYVAMTSSLLDVRFLTVKYSPEGQLLWAVRRPGDPVMQDTAGTVAVDGDLGVYVSGTTTQGAGQPTHTLLVRYDAAGNEQWTRTEKGPAGNGAGLYVQNDPTGGALLAGSYADAGGKSRGMLVRYSRDGARSWQALYPGAPAGTVGSMRAAVHTDGKVWAAVNTWDGTFNNDASKYAVVRYDAQGHQQWETRLPAPVGNNFGMSLALDPLGRPYVLGSGRPDLSVQEGLYTAALDDLGGVRWERLLPGSTFYHLQPAVLAVDGEGSVYVTGAKFSTLVNGQNVANFNTAKYDAADVAPPVELFDANPDSTRGIALPLLSPEADVSDLGTEAWASQARTPQFVAADGVALVLVRVELPLTAVGEAHLTLGGSGSLGSVWSITDTSLRDTSANGGARDQGGDGPQEVTVPTYQAGGKRWALALYRAPRDFDPPGGSTTIERSRDISLTICLPGRLGKGFGQQVRKTITLVRPLVILVHGTFSDPSTWSQFPLYVESRRQETRWQTPFTAPFCVATVMFDGDRSAFSSANYLLPQLTERVRLWARQTRTAAAQADVVTHSFGGVAVRVAATLQFDPGFNGSPERSFRSSANWGHGPVHKLVTLGTTHRGSALVNHMALLNYRSNGKANGWGSRLGKHFDRGVMADQFVMSGAESLLSRPTPFRGHAVLGSGLLEYASQESWLVDLMLRVAAPGDEYRTAVDGFPTTGMRRLSNYLFNLDYNVGGGDGGLNPNYDLVVSAHSAMGGLSGDAVSTFNGLQLQGRLPHTQLTSSREISDRVVYVLTKATGGSYFAPFPAVEGGSKTPVERRLEQLAKPEWLELVPPPIRTQGESGPVLATDPPAGAAPGQTVHVSVTWPGKPVASTLLLWSTGAKVLSQTLTGAQPAADVVVPADAQGSLKLLALVRATDGADGDVSTELPIDDPTVYTGVVADPPDLTFESGYPRPLTIYGQRGDGTWVDLTRSRSTVLVSANPGVAAATEPGEVRPVSVGSTEITVTVTGSGSVTVPVTVKVAPPASPNAPSGLTAVPEISQIDLGWSDNSANEDGFEIQRRTGSGSFFTIAMVGAGTTSYTDDGVSPKGSYGYRVRAVNAGGLSAFTPELRVTTLAEPGGKLKVAAKLAFGTVKRGASRVKQLQIQNTDKHATLSVAVNPPEGEGFSAEGVGVFSIPPRGKITVPVTFTPTAAGKRNGTLALRSGDPKKASATVKLTAAGK